MDGKEGRRAYFSLLRNILDVAQVVSLPIMEGELGHTPSLAAEEAGNSVVLGGYVPAVSQVFRCSENEVDQAIYWDKWTSLPYPFYVLFYHLTTLYTVFFHVI